MDFWQKLNRLSSEIGKTKASVGAGLAATAISNYITKKQIPRADAALRIARALKVPLDWLMDDAADWPPPKELELPRPSELSDYEIMTEVARRLRWAELETLSALDAAEKIDWQIVDRALKSWEPGQQPVPDVLAQTKRLIFDVELALRMLLTRFNPQHFLGTHATRPKDTFDKLMERMDKFLAESGSLNRSKMQAVPAPAILGIPDSVTVAQHFGGYFTERRLSALVQPIPPSSSSPATPTPSKKQERKLHRKP